MIEEYRSSFTIQGKGGIWHSGWLNRSAFRRLGKPDSWFVLEADPAFYRLNEKFPVRLTVDTALTVIQRTRPEVKMRGDVANITGFGQCRYVLTTTKGYPTTCFSPLFPANLLGDTLYLTYAPTPMTPSFDPFYTTNEDWSWTKPNFAQMSIEANVAQIRRQFEVKNLRLSDYQMDVPKIDGGSISF
jgi:hypothetical protein